MTWHDYDVRLYGDGDVAINSHGLVAYATLGGTSGLQCNDESRRHEIRVACQDVANAIKALDALLGEQNNVK